MPGEPDGSEVVEAADAEEGVAQDDQGPAVADDRQGPRHGAGQIADISPSHTEFQNGTYCFRVRECNPKVLAQGLDCEPVTASRLPAGS